MEKILCSGSEDGVISKLKKRRLDESERSRDANESHAAPVEVREGWNKAKWETEWLESFSKDVDILRRTRELTVTERSIAMEHVAHPKSRDETHSECASDGSQVPQRQPKQASYASTTTFDPLHFPSLFAFSVSLFGPLKARLDESVRGIWMVLNETQVRVALLGGFCLGVSFSLFAGR